MMVHHIRRARRRWSQTPLPRPPSRLSTSNAPAVIQTIAAEFRERLLGGTAYSMEHNHNDHTRMLTAVARATELGMHLLQRYPPPLLEQCFSDMEDKMAEMARQPELCSTTEAGSSYHCATCGIRVRSTHCAQHVQLHAGASFMSSVFPAYDPEKPHM